MSLTRVIAIVVTVASCAPALMARDWDRAVPEAACTVTMREPNQYQAHDERRLYDRQGRLLYGDNMLSYDTWSQEWLVYDDAGRVIRVEARTDAYRDEGVQDELFPRRRASPPGPWSPAGRWPEARTLETMWLEYDHHDRLKGVRTRAEIYRRDDDQFTLVDSKGTYEEYGYDRAGRLVRDGRIHLDWDGARLVRIWTWFSEYGDRAFRHDRAGRVIEEYSTKFPDGRREHFRYDDAGRLVAREVPGDDDFAELYAYDDAGRLVRSERRTTYDNGRIDSYVFSYEYDALGRLTVQRDNGEPRIFYRYRGACEALRNAGTPPSAVGVRPCVTSPRYVYSQCF